MNEAYSTYIYGTRLGGVYDGGFYVSVGTYLGWVYRWFGRPCDIPLYDILLLPLTTYAILYHSSDK